MRHAVRLGALLVGLWLALSGHFAPLLLALGIASCALALFVALRMDRVDGEAVPIDFGVGRWLGYVGWLGVEIVKSNLAVTRVVLDPRLPIQPSILWVDASQRSLLGRVSYANSITLTPGTVSIDLRSERGDHAVEVHSLLAPDRESLREMDRRVAALERPR